MTLFTSFINLIILYTCAIAEVLIVSKPTSRSLPIHRKAEVCMVGLHKPVLKQPCYHVTLAWRRWMWKIILLSWFSAHVFSRYVVTSLKSVMRQTYAADFLTKVYVIQCVVRRKSISIKFAPSVRYDIERRAYTSKLVLYCSYASLCNLDKSCQWCTLYFEKNTLLYLVM